MKKSIYIIICLALLSSFSISKLQAQGDGEEGIKIKMSQAWLKYNDGDYYGALRIYRDLIEKSPNHAMLNYRMGECYIALKQQTKALGHLEKAVKLDTAINKEIYFLLGQAYQSSGNIEKAIESYYKYKVQLKPRQLEKHQVNSFLLQCETAKELLAKPVDVKISNLGTNINSQFIDANPSVTADGKTMIFTSRRPNAKGDNIDPYTDGYFDDVYISKLDDVTKKWSQATPITGAINTEAHDADLSISPDGNKIFLYKNIMGETKSGDIYVSEKQADGTWGVPKALGKNVNSSYFESSACITADGNSLYFVSEREREGLGNGDIYVSTREGSDWGKAKNLGPIINSVDDEIGVFIHPDGKTLFFSSNGHKTMGGHDIFMSVLENGKWSEPINLGYPINTTKEEIHFLLSTDGKKAYISSNREGGEGEYDIYEIDMTNYYKSNQNLNKDVVDVLTGPALSIIKGTVYDDSSNPVSIDIVIKDESNAVVNTIKSNEKGEYFITLPAEKKFELIIENDVYKSFNFKFKLQAGKGETYTMTKHLILNKK